LVVSGIRNLDEFGRDGRTQIVKIVSWSAGLGEERDEASEILSSSPLLSGDISDLHDGGGVVPLRLEGSGTAGKEDACR
jgi:hypothetical protein